MCTQSEFAAMRERIVEVEKANIAQGEQVKALCESVKELKETVQGAFSKLLWICAVVMILAVSALVYGGLGDRGFHAVAGAVPAMTSMTEGGNHAVAD